MAFFRHLLPVLTGAALGCAATLLAQRFAQQGEPEHIVGPEAFDDAAEPEADAPETPVEAPAPLTPAAALKARKKAGKPSARPGRPPLSPEIYVETASHQYNVTDIVGRAKADYRATHKVGVQSCKIYIKPEEGVAYYVVNKVTGKLDL